MWELMSSLGDVFKQHGIKGKLKASKEERVDLERNLAQKIRYVQHKHGIADSLVFNFDDSAFRVMPMAGKGYKPSGAAAAVAVGDSTKTCTVSFLMPLVEDGL